MDKKDYQYKDLSSLSEDEKRKEICSYFDPINIPYNKMKVAEYLYNHEKVSGGRIYFYIEKVIIENFKEEDLSDENIGYMKTTFTWIRRLCVDIQDNDSIYYKVFDFCRKHNLTEKMYGIKGLIIGAKYLYMYCNCDKWRVLFTSKAFENMLDNIKTDEDVKTFLLNAKCLEEVQNIFKYNLDDKYPNNRKGLVTTLLECFRKIKEHYRGSFPDYKGNDPCEVLPLNIVSDLYRTAYVYEKCLLNIKEDDEEIPGKRRFADNFILTFMKMYTAHPSLVLHKSVAYSFNEMLKSLMSEDLPEFERFDDEEMKKFLMHNVRSVLGVDNDAEHIAEKREVIQELIDYANNGASKKAKIKDLIVETQNCGLFYSHINPIQEMVKLLKGETLGRAYGEEKDPFEEENFYKYYLRVLELKELYSDVKIEGVTPESVNKLIRENGAICNNVRSSNIQLVLNKLVDTLFDVMGLDDGDIYYLNEKIDKLNKILGVDVKTLITIQNLPYLLNSKVIVSMRKDGEDIMWFNFAENIKKLKDFYFISDLVKMIKYHPEVVFSDHNIIKRYLVKNDIYDLFDGKNIDGAFDGFVK